MNEYRDSNIYIFQGLRPGLWFGKADVRPIFSLFISDIHLMNITLALMSIEPTNLQILVRKTLYSISVFLRIVFSEILIDNERKKIAVLVSGGLLC